MKTLPKKPSKLLTLALKDLEAVEKEPLKYKIEMNFWFEPMENEPCAVCMAGATLVKSLEMPIIYDKTCMPFMPEHFPENRNQLHAINYFRQGYIEGALSELDVNHPLDLPSNVEVAQYKYSPKQFKKDIRKIIKMLEKFNL